MITDLCILGAMLLLLGGFARTEVLPRNWLFGMRTFATLRSPEAWRAAHAAVGAEVMLAGIACFGDAAVGLGSMTLGPAVALLPLALVVHAGARAHGIARRFNAPEAHQ